MVRVTALMDDHASEHKALTAEHGLSYLVEMPELRLLFDCGASPPDTGISLRRVLAPGTFI